MGHQEYRKISKMKLQKFCEHYAQYDNQTRAYLHAFPKANYNTAACHATQIIKRPDAIQLIDKIRQETLERLRISKNDMIDDLIKSAEEAKEANQFQAYAKLRDMVIKMVGLYEPQRVEMKNDISFDFGIQNDDDIDDEV